MSLIDIADAIAEELALPFNRISLEIMFADLTTLIVRIATM